MLLIFFKFKTCKLIVENLENSDAERKSKFYFRDF